MVNIEMRRDKTLWQQYGKWVLTVFGVFLLAYAGMQYYKDYQTKQSFKASATYDKMIFSIQKQDKAQVEMEAKQLTGKFARTPYASLAALVLAKFAIEENNLVVAKEHLHFVLKNGNGPIQQFAKVRLARVLADEKDYEAALTLLTKEITTKDYKTLFEETKGDIYLLQNNKDKAREAYQAAIDATPQEVPVTRLQLKQADLGDIKEGS